MASLKTEGFSLSALPRGQNIPANAGAVDVKAIYDGVREGLAAFETVRRAPASMALADATSSLATDQARSKQRLLPLAEAADAAESTLGEQQATTKSGILAATDPIGLAVAAEGDAKAKLVEAQNQRARAAELRQRAATEIPQARADFDAAMKLDDPAVQASDLAAIHAKYPSLALDDFKDFRGVVDANQKLAGTQAQKAADRASAETRATTIAEGGVRKAQIGAGPKSGPAALVKLMIDEGYTDEEINNVINKQGASEVASPNADRASREKVAQARITAQADATRANREMKLNQVDAVHQQKLSHALGALEGMENNTKHVNDLIDEAIALTDNTTAGLAKNLAFLPSDARTLRGKLDSIRSNIGFDALASMRQNSPTGGALGAVSDTENKLLQSTIEALDQGLDPQVLKQNLESVRRQRQISLDNLSKTYQRDSEIFKRPAAAATPAAQPVSAFSTPEEAAAAAAAGTIRAGDRITVGGVPGTWK